MGPDPQSPLSPEEPPTRVPLTIEKVVAAAAMGALCLITLGNVVARYLTNYSFAFTEEYSIALMVVVAMLGAAIATAANRQIRITWFVDLLPNSARRYAEILAATAIIGVFFLMVILGGRLVWDEYRFEVTSPGLGEPQWIYPLALPLLSLAIIGRAVGYLVRVAKAPRIRPPDPIEPM